MKQLHKYTTILLAFMTILALGIGVYVSCRPDTNDIQLKWGKVTNTGEQWSVSLTEDAHVATLRWTLPDSLPAGTTLAFKSNYMSATFFLEGQPFYTYGESPSSPFQTSFGQAFLTAELPASAAGKDIEIQCSSRWTIEKSLLTRQIYLGNKGDILFLLFDKNIGSLLFGLICLIISILFLVMSLLFFIKRHILRAYHVYLFLGLFVFLAGIWIVTDAELFQFVTSNVEAVFYISFLSFMLMPVPLLLFARSTQIHGKTALDLCALGILFNMLLCVGLHAGGILPLTDTVWMTHAWLLCCTVVMFVVCIREEWVHHNHTTRDILIALVVLCLSALLSITQFYQNSLWNNSFFFRIGLLVFIFLLSIAAFKRAIEVLNEHAEMEIYKQLAYFDMMTHLKNRAAFEKDQAALETNPTQLANLIYIVFDINNLKLANDTHGHAEGDRLIARAADYIHQYWQKAGYCYRIGGDEFVVRLTHSTVEQVRQSLEWLAKEMSQQEKHETIPLDMAWGYAEQESPPLSPEELMKRADANMYLAKQQCKTSRPS